ncbi:G-type lectin S-receptor serine/threonine-protein kinase [Salix suchowensis]|nr:G-type lectin S-receptor serine/threonine-protein kinase [Salix suchowensis]
MNNITILCFCFTSLFIPSLAVDTISADHTIGDGETIVSSGETFELGFFSPGKVVWVANREIPITDKSGVLKFDERGVLILAIQNGSVIWSSNSSRQAQNPVAQLLDSGNLVIRNEDDRSTENFVWQSFEHPGNTFLPGMKLGSLASGLHVIISSWKSNDDPSRGPYTFEIDAKGLELVVRKNSVLKSRSGPWNGVGFSDLPNVKPDPFLSYAFVSNDREAYLAYDIINSSIALTLVLNQNGVVERLAWIDRLNNWIVYSSAPGDTCDNYALCGAYGRCTIGNSPACGCLNRFVPKNQSEWARADWSSGCVPRTPLNCQNGDGFIKYHNIKLPESKIWAINRSMTTEECRMKCLNNCSCMAYTNSDIRGFGSGCILWFGDLVDIKQYTEDGQDLYIRMASSEVENNTLEGSPQKKKVAIIVSVVLSALLLLGLGLFLFLQKKKKKHNRHHMLGRTKKKENNTEEQWSMNSHDESLDLPHFDLAAIANATSNFSFNNLLGEGGFGPVYKGTFKGGQDIAVKRLSTESRQGLDEFMNEVKCIAKLQHRNLVKLLGYCIEHEEKILIYEYMPNKSLDIYIFDQVQSKLLDWPKRFHIINGVSRGLLYLHQDSRLRIIHRDLKLSNILLDNDMNPKISDFGLAKSFGGNETEANTRRVVGTYGYMSPEYAIDGNFSIKSDVFSFGVLVLEIVTGKRNRGFTHPEHDLNLLGHIWKLYKQGRSLELIDELEVESCYVSEVLKSIHVGLLCVQHSPEHRPSMSTVVLMLGGDGVLPQPKEPGFFIERKLNEENKKDLNSTNEVTITTIDGR